MEVITFPGINLGIVMYQNYPVFQPEGKITTMATGPLSFGVYWIHDLFRLSESGSRSYQEILRNMDNKGKVRVT